MSTITVTACFAVAISTVALLACVVVIPTIYGQMGDLETEVMTELHEFKVRG